MLWSQGSRPGQGYTVLGNCEVSPSHRKWYCHGGIQAQWPLPELRPGLLDTESIMPPQFKSRITDSQLVAFDVKR